MAHTKTPTTHIWVDGSYVYQRAENNHINAYGAVLDMYYTPYKKEIAGTVHHPQLKSSGCEIMAVIIALLHVDPACRHIKTQVYCDYITIRDIMQNRITLTRERTHYDLYRTLKNVASTFDDISFFYVKGHNANKGNSRAHALANNARKNASDTRKCQSVYRFYEWNVLTKHEETIDVKVNHQPKSLYDALRTSIISLNYPACLQRLNEIKNI